MTEEALADDICKVWAGFLEITGHDVSRNGDLEEIVFHIHALQNMVMAQAGARTMPGKFRLLGETLG